MKKISPVAILALAGMMTCANVAYAETAEIFTTANTAEELTTGDVIVSATRTEQMVADVPSAVEVITSEEIKRMGASTVQQILNNSYNMTTDGHNGGYSIRGMSSSQTKVLINGRAPVVYGSKNETVRRTLDMVPAENIERIEILRGPASALYGEAMAGVINIITKQSTEPSTTLDLTYGSRYADGVFRHDTGIVDNWSDVFAIEVKRYWGYKDNDSQWPNNTGYSRYSNNTEAYTTNVYLSNSLAYNFDTGHKIQLDSNYLDFVNVIARGSVADYGEDAFSNLLTYTGDLGDHSFSAGVSHSVTNRGNENDNTNQDWTVISVDAQDTWFISDNNILTFGGKAEFVDANTKVYNNTTGARDPRTGNTEQYGAFVQDEISLLDERLYIVPAIRFDYYNSFGFYYSPKLGATYEYIPNHRVKANIGTGYSAPNVTQLYGQSQGGSTITLASPNLEPEENFSWEARLEGDVLNDTLSYAIGYYFNDITNMIQSGPIQYTGLDSDGDTVYYRQNVNIGKARTQGIEAEISYDFLDYFTATVQYAYNDAKNLDTNTRLDAIATNVFMGRLDFYQPQWGLYASLWGKYNNDFNDQEYSNQKFDFYRVSGSVSYEMTDRHTISFIAENFFQSTEDRYNAGYIEPTEYKLNLQIKF